MAYSWRTRAAVWSGSAGGCGGTGLVGGAARSKVNMISSSIRCGSAVWSPQETHMLLVRATRSFKAPISQSSSPIAIRSAVISTGTLPGKLKLRIRQAVATAAVISWFLVRTTMPVRQLGCLSMPIPM